MELQSEVRPEEGFDNGEDVPMMKKIVSFTLLLANVSPEFPSSGLTYSYIILFIPSLLTSLCCSSDDDFLPLEKMGKGTMGKRAISPF